MTLKATVESLDGLSEELAGEYKQIEGGGYRLAALEGYESADDVRGLKTALAKERENVRTAVQQAKESGAKLGEVDLDKYNALLEQDSQRAEQEARKAGEWDKLKQQMTDAQHKALGEKDVVANKYKTALERNLIDKEAALVCAELDGNAALLLPHIRAMVQVTEVGDDFVTRVVDAAGTPRINGEGAFLGLKDLVSEMRDQETYQGAFKGSKQSGGGTPPGGAAGDAGGDKGGTPDVSNLKRGSMDATAKAQFISEHGLDKFMSIPA